MKRLVRSINNRKICGVCGGIGDYLNIDPTVIRLIWILVTLVSWGIALIAYIIAALVMPEA